MSDIEHQKRRSSAVPVEEPETWTYHDVPVPELEEAQARGAIVVAACGFSFYPVPIPQKRILIAPSPEKDLDIKQVAAVKLIKCQICAEINHNHFGERPEHESWV